MLNAKRNFGQVASKMFDLIEHIPDAKEEATQESESRQYQVDRPFAAAPAVPTATAIPPAAPASSAPVFAPVPPPVAPRPVAPKPVAAPLLTSVFAEDLVIQGRIQAKGNIEMRGKIEGDLVTTGNISISGIVTGDLKGCNIQISHGAVKGNITAEQSIDVDQESLIVGDVRATNIRNSGYIKGNLGIKNKSILASGSCLVGDIETNSILLEEGAVLAGSIQMNCGNADEIFPKEGEELKLRKKIELTAAARLGLTEELV